MNRPLAQQKEVLSKGLNFTLAPTRSVRQLQDKDVEDLQGWVCGILGQGKLPKYNLLREQRKALKELRDLEDGVT